VFKVVRKSDGKEYALKKVSKERFNFDQVKLAKLTQKEKDNAINEVRIQASINHPNVAGYKEAFFETATSTLCIVMEYADGGDLQTKINTLKKTTTYMKEADVWSIFY
jgi:NIMA (never in mitosis gene a)-related kinase